ncbi:hypothetical protein Btru_069928 [Bulinus truncatus]|nr:hypothetical protein Btru_069928 [Bulinus truncatus]
MWAPVYVLFGLFVAATEGQRDMSIISYEVLSFSKCPETVVATKDYFTIKGDLDFSRRYRWPHRYYFGFGTLDLEGREYVECVLNLRWQACGRNPLAYTSNTCYCESKTNNVYRMVFNGSVEMEYKGAQFFMWWGDFFEGDRTSYINFHHTVVGKVWCGDNLSVVW